MNGTIQKRPGSAQPDEAAEPQHDGALPLLRDPGACISDDADERAITITGTAMPVASHAAPPPASATPAASRSTMTLMRGTLGAGPSRRDG